jgi:hypothetical protein
MINKHCLSFASSKELPDARNTGTLMYRDLRIRISGNANQRTLVCTACQPS